MLAACRARTGSVLRPRMAHPSERAVSAARLQTRPEPSPTGRYRTQRTLSETGALRPVGGRERYRRHVLGARRAFPTGRTSTVCLRSTGREDCLLPQRRGGLDLAVAGFARDADCTAGGRSLSGSSSPLLRSSRMLRVRLQRGVRDAVLDVGRGAGERAHHLGSAVPSAVQGVTATGRPARCARRVSDLAAGRPLDAPGFTSTSSSASARCLEVAGELDLAASVDLRAALTELVDRRRRGDDRPVRGSRSSTRRRWPPWCTWTRIWPHAGVPDGRD